MKAHSEEVTVSTKAQSEESGRSADEKFDVGTYQKDMGAKWRGLTDEEKAEWEEKDMPIIADEDEVYL